MRFGKKSEMKRKIQCNIKDIAGITVEHLYTKQISELDNP